MAVGLFGLRAQAQEFTPFRIPLYIFNVGSEDAPQYKVGINLQVGSVTDGSNTPWRMYEFDTGGTGFFAFPYSATENTQGEYSLSYASGNELSAHLSNTSVTFEVTDGGAPASLQSNIGLISSASNPTHPDKSINQWTERLPNEAPLEKYFYGDFGMGLGSLPSTANTPNPVSLFALIPQFGNSANAGFVIHLGDVPASGVGKGLIGTGWVQVGLTTNQLEASHWDATAKMVTPSGETFLNSGQKVYEEILSNGTTSISTSPTDGTPLTFTNIGIVYDTGAPNTEIHPVGADAGDYSDVSQALADALANGGSFSLIGQPYEASNDSTILDTPVGNVSGLNSIGLSTQNVIDSPALYVNTGITAFFGKDVAFNLQDGYVGFNTVPEPNSSALFGISLLIGGWYVIRRSWSGYRRKKAL
ncbi:PEP-CTERM sorting domain-containing protein [Terrimicrobium sacchariphilum]|nr:PEP-CTERM sorting domain-containing protein [Terrimicrobium sacchariphilum]